MFRHFGPYDINTFNFKHGETKFGGMFAYPEAAGGMKEVRRSKPELLSDQQIAMTWVGMCTAKACGVTLSLIHI